jgi:hypothetical protein
MEEKGIWAAPAIYSPLEGSKLLEREREERKAKLILRCNDVRLKWVSSLGTSHPATPGLTEILKRIGFAYLCSFF